MKRSIRRSIGGCSGDWPGRGVCRLRSADQSPRGDAASEADSADGKSFTADVARSPPGNPQPASRLRPSGRSPSSCEPARRPRDVPGCSRPLQASQAGRGGALRTRSVSRDFSRSAREGCSLAGALQSRRGEKRSRRPPGREDPRPHCVRAIRPGRSRASRAWPQGAGGAEGLGEISLSHARRRRICSRGLSCTRVERVRARWIEDASAAGTSPARGITPVACGMPSISGIWTSMIQESWRPGVELVDGLPAHCRTASTAQPSRSAMPIATIRLTSLSSARRMRRGIGSLASSAPGAIGRARDVSGDRTTPSAPSLQHLRVKPEGAAPGPGCSSMPGSGRP